MIAETGQFLANYGAPLLFGAVFLDQMGLPLPAAPWLLAAGAFSATQRFNLVGAISVTVLACLIADAIWFYLGRYRGNQVLNLLCRIALEPDSCVRRTQNLFIRYGLKGVLVAKFVPGLGTVAPPLAGMTGIHAGRFLLVDGFGSLLYGSSFVFLGFFFSEQIQEIGGALASIGGSAVALLVIMIGGYVAFKYWQRRRLLRELRMTRITVAELRQKQEAGEELVILDLRSSAELAQDPTLILGARHVSMDELQTRLEDLPHDRDIVVYCSCPNEVTSARIALALQRKGFTRIRPLKGGLDAWRESNFPVEVFAQLSLSLTTPSTLITNETVR